MTHPRQIRFAHGLTLLPLLCVLFTGILPATPASYDPWASRKAPAAGARTIWDDLPEVSPWRFNKWAEVYKGEMRPAREILTQIEAALKAGQKTIRVAPGLYGTESGDPNRYKIGLKIEGLTNVELVMEGVVLLSRARRETLMIVENCSGVRLRGLTLDIHTDTFHFTQGTVLETDASARTSIVELHAGYPEPLLVNGRVRKGAIHLPGSLMLKPRVFTLDDFPVAAVGARRYRVDSGVSTSNIAVGDYMTFTFHDGIHAVQLVNLSNAVLEEVTLHGSRMFCLIDIQGYNTILRRCRLTPGPMPEGASIPRLKASSQDGFHFKSKRGELSVVEDSLIECHDDDAVAANTPFYPLFRAEDRASALLLSLPGTLHLSAGTRASLSSYETMGVYETVRITAVEAIKDPETMRILRGKRFPYALYQATLDRAPSAPCYRLRFDKEVDLADFDLACTLENNRGLAIRRNFIRNSRARGLMLKCSDIAIESNVILQTQTSAFKGEPELFWLEASHPWNVLIRGNLFRNVGFDPSPKGCGMVTASIHGTRGPSAAGGLRQYRILDNHFERFYTPPIRLASIQGAEITGNRFSNPASPIASVIELLNCADVKIERNLFDASLRLQPEQYVTKAEKATLTASQLAKLPGEKWLTLDSASEAAELSGPCAFTKDEKKAGAGSLRFDYEVAPGAWDSALAFKNADLRRFRGIRFWLKPDNSGLAVWLYRSSAWNEKAEVAKLTGTAWIPVTVFFKDLHSASFSEGKVDGDFTQVPFHLSIATMKKNGGEPVRGTVYLDEFEMIP